MSPRGSQPFAAVALLLCFWASACPTDSEAKSSESSSTSPRPVLPIHTDTGHIILEARVEDGDPCWFILDTGNQMTAVFEGVLTALGIETEPRGEMGGAGSGSILVREARDVRVSLGGTDPEIAWVDSLVLVLPDQARLPEFGGRTIDGFLGATFIERYVVSIDYERGDLLLHDPLAYAPAAGSRTLEMKLEAGFPYFRGRVVAAIYGEPTEPIEGNFLLDLGAAYDVQIDYEFTKRIGLLDTDDPAQRVAGEGRGIDGVMFEFRSAPAVSVEMGGEALPLDRVTLVTTPGGGPPIDELVGSVGSAAFPGSIVTLDYEGERLILEPEDSYR